MDKKRIMLISIMIVALGVLPWLAVYAARLQSRQDFQGFVGSLYRDNPAKAEQLLRDAFSYREHASRTDLSVGKDVVKNLGYTEEAFRLLFPVKGLSALSVFILLLSCVVVGGLLFYVKKNEAYRRWYMRELCERIYRDLNGTTDFEAIREGNEWEMLEAEIGEILTKRRGQQRYLDKREKQIQLYIENIVHQIKTPLAGMLLNLERIKTRLSRMSESSERKESDGIIEDSLGLGEKIQQYIMQLLSLARMEAGKIHFRKDAVELSELLEEAQKKYGSDMLILEQMPAEEVLIRGDREWLFEALCNMIENALSHGAVDEPVKLSLVDLMDEVQLAVVDTGEGIDEDEMERIFERYYTGSDNRQFATGIGMHLARYVVRGHYGDIHIESRKGAGTTVHFCLPKIVLKEKIEI